MTKIISFILSFIAAFGLYPKAGYIMEVDQENSKIVIEDSTGNLWEYSADGEDWVEGDGCAMIMYDNGTEIIYDDQIMSIRYTGFWKGE